VRRLLLAVLAALVVVAPAAALPTARHDPQKRLNARDQAKARSLLLRQADLGSGWTSTAAPATRGGNLSCAGFDPDLSDLVETGDAQSRVFAHGIGTTVFSTATVYADARTAEASWQRVIRPALVRCLSTLLEGSSPGGVEIKTLSSGRLAFAHVAPRSAAFRIAVEVKAFGVATRIYVDLFALGSGRLESGVFLVSIRQPLTPSFERRLARSLAHRLV